MLVEFHSSPIHGTGAFAGQTIQSGTRIIEYAGEQITKDESLRRCQAGNPFIFYLSSEEDLDGNVESNPARWLNHSCAPNCEAELLESRIWLVAKRLISQGEELTFDYGYDLDEFREYPCHCGAPNCFGYILAEIFRSHRPE